MSRLSIAALVVSCALLPTLSALPANSEDVRRLLSPEQNQAYEQVMSRRRAQDALRARYWSEVEHLRGVRQSKRRTGQVIVEADSMRRHPPLLPRIEMPPDIVAVLRRPEGQQKSSPPSLADIMAAARAHYGFEPQLVAEADFKRRYRDAALAAGLEPLHVIRVYALETGGVGTFDMQSGISHQTGQGRPASTAIGYSQLLAANTIGELAKRGDEFIRVLEQRPIRAAAFRHELPRRIQSLRSMVRTARSVPNNWTDHVALAATAPGYGMHAINLDGDIGPMLQIGKLRDLLVTARRELGRERITGAELEIMNLAGPRNGLDMILEPGRRMPTANFFTSSGYARNPVVHARNGDELLAMLDQRMDVHMAKTGTREFIDVFRQLTLPRIGATTNDPPRTSIGATR